jgi:hypothetical protein
VKPDPNDHNFTQKVFVMLNASFRFASPAVLGISIFASVCLNKPQAWSQEAPQIIAQNPMLPASALESLRSQLNPFQPQKLHMLLLKPEVQAELEFDRLSFNQVNSAMMELNKKQMESSISLKSIERTDREALNERLEKLRTHQAERERAIEDALNELFPPEKSRRLKQIALQVQIQEVGLDMVLVYGAIGESLKLTDAQRDELAAKAEEYEVEKQAKIRKIVEDYDNKLLKQLSPKQRKQVDEQIGEHFEYDTRPPARQMFKNIRDLQKRRSPLP